jgi:hypothetical protein
MRSVLTSVLNLRNYYLLVHPLILRKPKVDIVLFIKNKNKIERGCAASHPSLLLRVATRHLSFLFSSK